MTGKYDTQQIAKELTDTALGRAYYGSALLAAKDMPLLTDEERQVVLRYLDGAQRGTDHVALQDIANRIAAGPKVMPAPAEAPPFELTPPPPGPAPEVGFGAVEESDHA